MNRPITNSSRLSHDAPLAYLNSRYVVARCSQLCRVAPFPPGLRKCGSGPVVELAAAHQHQTHGLRRKHRAAVVRLDVLIPPISRPHVRDTSERRQPERRHGHRSICAEISVHVLRAGRPHRVSRRHRHRTMPEDIFPEINIPVVSVIWQYTGPQHAGDGAARHHLQPVLDQHQRDRHQEHGGADAQRHLGAEDLFPARRQPRPRHRADRLGDELDPRPDAGGHPAADRRRSTTPRAFRCCSSASAPTVSTSSSSTTTGSTTCASSWRRCRA